MFEVSAKPLGSYDVAVCGGGIAVEYFGYGFGFVGLTLFMMQQIAPGKYQMSHYALASAIMNFGVMLPGMLSGWVWELLGGYRPYGGIKLLRRT